MSTSKQYLLAQDLCMSTSRLSRIKHGNLNAADLAEAEKLSRYFKTDIRIWLKGGDVARRQEIVNAAVAAMGPVVCSPLSGDGAAGSL